MGITQRLLLSSVFGVIVSTPMLGVTSPGAQAQSAWSIPARQAQGYFGPAPVLMVPPGMGLNLSLIQTEETIKKAWLEDPSRITIDADGSLCSALESETESCNDSGAKVLHLKQIKPLNFPQLPPSPQGTLLSLVTEAPSGSREIYHFQIKYGLANPQYHTVRIIPEKPIATVVSLSEAQRTLLVDLEKGLATAVERKQIQPQGPMWQAVRKFISLVRNGSNSEAAAQSAGIKLSVVSKLAEMGKQPAQAGQGVPPAAIRK